MKHLTLRKKLEVSFNHNIIKYCYINLFFINKQEEEKVLSSKVRQYKSPRGGRHNELVKEIEVHQQFLNCSLCKLRRKNTIITKCFHVFCSVCLKGSVINIGLQTVE
jgi:hypothetical protein